MASEASSEHLISKNFLGEHAPRPPLVCLCKLDIHVTPLLKILATGLITKKTEVLTQTAPHIAYNQRQILVKSSHYVRKS